MMKICTAEGVQGGSAHLVWQAAAEVGGRVGLSLEQRRFKLLRMLRATLGPAQLQHLTAHCEAVSRAASGLAILMGLEGPRVERSRLAGLLHDIGKALTPEDLLAKPGPLSAEERAVLDRHPEDGARLCAALGADQAICDAVRFHHARHDAGATPIEAQIVAVADSLVTMTTDRPYSAARSFAEALAELRRERGARYNPDAVVAAHILGARTMSLAA